MIVLDSSGWIEFFAEGPHAAEFADRLRQPANVITPTIAVYEVYKWIKRERSEDEALAAVATMKKTTVADLTEEIALTAADLSLAHACTSTVSRGSHQPDRIPTASFFDPKRPWHRSQTPPSPMKGRSFSDPNDLLLR